MAEEHPKVLIACPTWDEKGYILERYLERIDELTYPNFELLMLDNSKTDDYAYVIKQMGVKVRRIKWIEASRQRIAAARNYMRDYFLTGDYDYFFSLEQDVIPPKDVIEQLLAHKKKVVCGWYYISAPPHSRPCLSIEWKRQGNSFAPGTPFLLQMANEKLMKVFLGSFGCMMIHRSVLKKIDFKAYKTPASMKGMYDDTWFSYDCDTEKIDVWCDTTLLVPHFPDYRWHVVREEDRVCKINESLLRLPVDYEEVELQD